MSKWESKDFEGNSNKFWAKIAETLMEAAVVVLGKTKGGKSIQKETAWWNDAVKQQVKDKKTKFKKWQRTRCSRPTRIPGGKEDDEENGGRGKGQSI